jgi:hypothetical protein
VHLECASFRNEAGRGFDEIAMVRGGGNAARTAQLLIDEGARGADSGRKPSGLARPRGPTRELG